jgi:lipopolysaccharide transport protein LptA
MSPRSEAELLWWNMKKVFVVITLFIASLAFGQSSGPVKIHADSMQYYGEQNKSVFTGNVVAVSETYTLTASKLELFITQQNQVEKILCEGNVNFNTKDILAVSDKADLDQASKIITLNGNAKIWQNANYLEGEHVRIQYETREIFVDKGSSERVVIIFNPADNTTKADNSSVLP